MPCRGARVDIFFRRTDPKPISNPIATKTPPLSPMLSIQAPLPTPDLGGMDLCSTPFPQQQLSGTNTLGVVGIVGFSALPTVGSRGWRTSATSSSAMRKSPKRV